MMITNIYSNVTYCYFCHLRTGMWTCVHNRSWFSLAKTHTQTVGCMDYSVAVIHCSEWVYSDTLQPSWCSCPPLPPDRWWCEGRQCVPGWWMGWLLSDYQWPTAQPTHSPPHHTDTWGGCCQFYTHKGQLGGSEWGPLNLHKQLQKI